MLASAAPKVFVSARATRVWWRNLGVASALVLSVVGVYQYTYYKMKTVRSWPMRWWWLAGCLAAVRAVCGRKNTRVRGCWRRLHRCIWCGEVPQMQLRTLLPG